MRFSGLIATFQRAIIGSLTDLNYYVEVLNKPARSSLKIIAWFYLLLSVLLTGIFAFKDIPQIDSRWNQIREQVVSNYLEGLFFEWKDNKLTTNAPLPFTIPFPTALEPMETAPDNLAVIDTSSDTKPETLSALFYVTTDKLFINTLRGEWTEAYINEVVEVDEALINRESVLKLAEESKEKQRQVLFILPWGALLFFSIGLFVVRLLHIFLYALIVQLFFQLFNKPLPLKKVFQLCLHVLIPTELVAQITSMLFPDLDFPMFGFTFWMIISLLLWHMRHLQVLKVSVKKPESGIEKK